MVAVNRASTTFVGNQNRGNFYHEKIYYGIYTDDNVRGDVAANSNNIIRTDAVLSNAQRAGRGLQTPEFLQAASQIY